MRQASLFPVQNPTFHGGELSPGRRKTRRPLARKRPIHLVLKASRRVLEARATIRDEILDKSARFEIRVYDLAVNTDHVHLVITIPGRREYVAFIRSLSGVLARKLGAGLWKLIPFTRVGTWGKDFLGMKRYAKQNREEANFERPYVPRVDRYKRFRNKP